MVAYLGMSDKLQNLCYYNAQGEGFTKPYSDKTAELIDNEVQRMISEQYERAKRLLTENAAKHNALADLLVEREVIFTEDAEKIFGPRPWKSRTDILMEEEAMKLVDERNRKLEAEAKAKEAEAKAEEAKETENQKAEGAATAETKSAETKSAETESNAESKLESHADLQTNNQSDNQADNHSINA